MKIAIYLSGQPRYLQEDWIWNSITNLFNEHEVDFYFHFWESKQLSNDYILERIKPKQYAFDSQIDFKPQADYIIDRSPDRTLPYVGYFNMMSFYHSFAQARTIVPAKEYDFIFKTRTDIFFTNPLNHFVTGCNRQLYIDPCWKKPNNRLGDLCFFCDPNIFHRVLGLVEMAGAPKTYMNDFNRQLDGRRLTSHRYLGYAFKKYNIDWASVPMEIMFMRPFIKGRDFKSIAKDYIKHGQEVHTQLLLLNFPEERGWITDEIRRQHKTLKDKRLLTK